MIEFTATERKRMRLVSAVSANLDHITELTHYFEHSAVNTKTDDCEECKENARFLYDLRLQWLSLRREVERGAFDNDEYGSRFKNACIRLNIKERDYFRARLCCC